MTQEGNLAGNEKKGECFFEWKLHIIM